MSSFPIHSHRKERETWERARLCEQETYTKREWANPREAISIRYHCKDTSVTAIVVGCFSVMWHQWRVTIRVYISWTRWIVASVAPPFGPSRRPHQQDSIGRECTVYGTFVGLRDRIDDGSIIFCHICGTLVSEVQVIH